jgi:hypothetical protein
MSKSEDFKSYCAAIDFADAISMPRHKDQLEALATLKRKKGFAAEPILYRALCREARKTQSTVAQVVKLAIVEYLNRVAGRENDEQT